MTPSEEMNLYLTDRNAWLKLVAPRMPAVIDSETDDELRRGWELMERDFQIATWEFLNEPQRDRVKRLRKVAA